MRIMLLGAILLLSACSSASETASAPKAAPGFASVDALCRTKGPRGSFDYDICYRNQPEIQAAEREQRMGTMAIIAANRSVRAPLGRSYPVD